MRILQVLPVYSRHGEYGGPSTVAINQSVALAQLGHDVTLIAGDLQPDIPASVEGVELITFPITTIGGGQSFTRVCSPRMLTWLRHHARSFDIAHIHLSRDFVSLPAARLLNAMNVATCVQTHGMINPRTSLIHRAIDTVFTKPAVRKAYRAFYLNDTERKKLERAIGDQPRYDLLINGVPADTSTRARAHDDGSSPTEVLFLARLHRRKRPLTFAMAAAQLARDYPARFTIIGPDEGEGMALDEFLADLAEREGSSVAHRIQRLEPVSADVVSERLAKSDIYVLPSVNEPLPMSVLEAMAAGLPVIITETCGFAELVEQADAGTVVDDTVEGLVKAIARMLDDPIAARAQGQRGRHVVHETWSVASVARQLELEYFAAER
ncbi:glycosyltransferase [Gordonia sp. ABSL49_1]|uniref:glycosyltransferase n=1 Tax=Gordonia sp. ABSL49_1 TaxID=2920941 RepID=UPI001F0FCF49|nr:glycosyltransferase [Gordonia sp. ABSL49_1]MCH5645474.1 glycosyltransferase [Gordonia sp. ABSL49_1]